MAQIINYSLSYMITVSNAGPVAHNVVLSDRLPSPPNFVPAATGNPTPVSRACLRDRRHRRVSPARRSPLGCPALSTALPVGPDGKVSLTLGLVRWWGRRYCRPHMESAG